MVAIGKHTVYEVQLNRKDMDKIWDNIIGPIEIDGHSIQLVFKEE